jgi:signal transduction histidine kinase
MKSHSIRVAVLAVLFLSTSVLFSVAQDQAMNMKGHQLTKKEVKALIVSAKTPEDHMKLASYFKGEARQQEASAKTHAEMAELYKNNPIAEGEMAKHCDNLSEALKKAAEAANSIAAEHERMAAQLRQKK